MLPGLNGRSKGSAFHLYTRALILGDVNFMPWTKLSCILALFANLELLHFRHPPQNRLMLPLRAQRSYPEQNDVGFVRCSPNQLQAGT